MALNFTAAQVLLQLDDARSGRSVSVPSSRTGPGGKSVLWPPRCRTQGT